jgi:hypothetical protein
MKILSTLSLFSLNLGGREWEIWLGWALPSPLSSVEGMELGTGVGVLIIVILQEIHIFDGHPNPFPKQFMSVPF